MRYCITDSTLAKMLKVYRNQIFCHIPHNTLLKAYFLYTHENIEIFGRPINDHDEMFNKSKYHVKLLNSTKQITPLEIY